jgi:CRP-like cAMP-binding protein
MSAGQFKVENYMANSFITVEGKKNSDTFFIILKGQVKISTENPSLTDDAGSLLGPGDFFGVISCMSGHARTETAVSASPVSVITVRKDQFGELIQKNPAVAMKIIRFFSRKLREYDQSITQLTLKNAADETPEHLHTIGEYYLQRKSFNHAVYAFQRFLQYCPTSANADKAVTRLQQMKAPLKAPESRDEMQRLTRTYKDNQMIFCENELGHELYIIQAGQVKITKIVSEEILLAVLKPGDIFGEMAILENRPRSASAISFGEVTLMAVNKSNFETMVQAQPQLATKLITLLSERIWTAYRQLENLTIRDTVGRAYDTLLLQIEKQKIIIRPKQSHNFQFGIDELMKMIGLPKEKSNTVLAQLFDDKLISIDGGKIICNDINELEKVSQFYRKKSAMDRKREAAKNL